MIINIKRFFLFNVVSPIITMTRNPDSKEVPVSTAVSVTCSVMSYPASSIRWEQQTNNVYRTLNDFTVRNDTSNMFSVITNSTIMVTSGQINGASQYCCAATNMIGSTVKCLDFTERGMFLPIQFGVCANLYCVMAGYIEGYTFSMTLYIQAFKMLGSMLIYVFNCHAVFILPLHVAPLIVTKDAPCPYGVKSCCSTSAFI